MFRLATSDLSVRFPVFGRQRRSELTFSHALGPSDALAGRLCSEIVQGRVWGEPLLMVFYGFLALGGEPERRGYRHLYC